MGHDARDIANALIARGLDTAKPRDPLQLIKMTYLCHGWMLGLYHRPMSRQAVEAWQYGPVIAVVYHAVKRHGRKPVLTFIQAPRPRRAEAGFDPLEEDLVDQVFDVYERFSGIELSMMTHTKGSPWHTTRYRTDWTEKNATIQNHLIEEHFAAAADGNG